MFWLFMTGSLFGAVLEGLYCLFIHGHWETHVVSMWGPFCILYGIGAVGYYIGAVKLKDQSRFVRFLIYGCVGSGIELICGLLLEKGLNMYAWNYSGQFLNYHGHISLAMTVAWGLLGLLFEFCVPPVDRAFGKLKGGSWDIAVKILTVFMAVNFIFTGICIVRWSSRHKGRDPRNRFERYIDSRYNDEYMQERFIEWNFLDGITL